MPRVETRESENEEESKFTKMLNQEMRRPQHHASIDTRGNSGLLWRHNS